MTNLCRINRLYWPVAQLVELELVSIGARLPEEGPLDWLIMLDLSQARAVTTLSLAKKRQVPHRTKTQSSMLHLQSATAAAQAIPNRQSQTTLAILRQWNHQDLAGRQPNSGLTAR